MILPGGKRHENESLEECAHRELFEETGLRAIESYFVSYHISRPPNGPETHNIGVLVTQFEGKLSRREPNQNSDWQWYDINNLPQPLFKFVRPAIEACIQEDFTGKAWANIEEQRRVNQPGYDQLRLDLDI